MYKMSDKLASISILLVLLVTQYVVCRPQSDSSRQGIDIRNDRDHQSVPEDNVGLPRTTFAAKEEDYSRYVEINRKKPIERTKYTKPDDEYKRYNKKPSLYKYIESEKKYFDYFPIEDVQLESDPNESNIRFILLSPVDLEKKLEKLSRRSKRDVSSVAKPEESVPAEYVAPSDNSKKIKRNLGYYVSDRDGGVFYLPGSYYNQGLPPSIPLVGVPVRGGYSYRKPPPVPGNYYNAFTPLGNFPPRANFTITGRFGETYDTDAPVWSITYTNRNRPLDGSQGVKRPTPTPAPRPEPQSTHPPLIHGPEDNADYDEYDFAKPVPPRGDNTINERPHVPPVYSRPPPPRGGAPSSCVWAIVNCCKRRSKEVRENCFEQVGCQGSFWDYNPCSDFIQEKAYNHAQNYYDY